MDKKRTILCVDDEKINLLIFERTFREKYEVVTAEIASIALDILEKRADINIVVSDMRMPGMTGLEFIGEANKLYTDKTYFILSGFDITPEIQAALDANLITGYFQKPANFSKLEEAFPDLP